MSTGAGADAAASDRSDTDTRGGAAPLGRTLPRVLCVDDEPAILAMLERALEAEFEVVVHSDPEQALTLVPHGRFSVVISDMKMPGMSGEAFLEQVKKLDPRSTRLALTAGLDWQLPTETAFGILTKPVTLPLLRATVAAAAQFHALARAAEPSEPPPEPARSSARPIARGATTFVESGLRPRQREAASPGREVSSPEREAARSSPPGPVRLRLSLLGARVDLWPRATVLGRAMDCDIVVRDERIAPRHLRFFSSWRGVTVQDVSGTVGSARLNGAPLGGVRLLQPGDRIDLGPFEICVEAPDP